MLWNGPTTEVRAKLADGPRFESGSIGRVGDVEVGNRPYGDSNRLETHGDANSEPSPTSEEAAKMNDRTRFEPPHVIRENEQEVVINYAETLSEVRLVLRR